MKQSWAASWLLITVLLQGCTAVQALPASMTSPTNIETMTPNFTTEATFTRETATYPVRPSPTVSSTKPAAPTTAASSTKAVDSRLQPADWQDWPVVPTISDRAREIYAHGQVAGNDPFSFIKIGDCESTPTWFLGDFDDPDYQIASEFAVLQPLLDQFHGSWGRTSVAAKSSFSAASILSPFWADPNQCNKDETPLDCEMRIMQPSFALVTLGTNDVPHKEKFEQNLRQIIDQLIAHGVLPILATKADNLEGKHTINQIIVKLAFEYDLPLWNFWLAVQDLPDKGLQQDKAHLTWAPNRFDDPKAILKAWPQRNLTAILVLQAVVNGVQ